MKDMKRDIYKEEIEDMRKLTNNKDKTKRIHDKRRRFMTNEEDS